MFKLPQFTLWHMLPIAVGLHALLFAIPIPSIDDKAEKPSSEESVAVVNLPKPSPSSVPPPKPKPQSTPKVQPSLRAIAKPATPTPQPPIQSQPQSFPQPSPSLSPSPSPSPSLSPSPPPTDILQITGAAPGCNGRAECWQLAESNGRTVAAKLEQHLEQQGFVLTQKELDQETGFRVYEVSKNGVKQYYLHMIWSDRGTAYVRDNNLLSHSQLSVITGL